MIKKDSGAIGKHPDDIERILLHHFHKRWTCQQGVPDIGNPIIQWQVTSEINNKLIRLVTMGEVKMVINEMIPNKAPGLDSFSTIFFQIFWYRINGEVVHVIWHFFSFGRLPNLRIYYSNS